MGLQAAHRLRGAEIGHLGGRMPGRSRRQFIALQQHAVGDAFPGQVIEQAAAADTTADNHDLGVRFHVRASSGPPAALIRPPDIA